MIMNYRHNICITRVANTVCDLLGIRCHDNAHPAIDEVLETAKSRLENEKCSRVFIYNPDGIADWIYQKYKADFASVDEISDSTVPMLSVMPSVTPVCFASMYSGVMPDIHGIQAYVKPVLTVDTLFDDIIRAGKRAAIVSTAGDSISKIFLERDMDYYIYPSKQECNDKAMELIREDKYHLIVLYNGDYDGRMHHCSPEGEDALVALKENIDTYLSVYEEIKKCWSSHNSALVFAPDHGCHAIENGQGGHGTEDSCDMDIVHFYSFLKKDE